MYKHIHIHTFRKINLEDNSVLIYLYTIILEGNVIFLYIDIP